MSTYIEIKTSSGKTILVEVDETVSTVLALPTAPLKDMSQKVGLIGNMAEKTQEAVEKIIDKTNEKVDELVKNVIVGNVDLLTAAIAELQPKPEKTEISFGLKFTAEGNIGIGKLGGEFHYDVKLTYQ